MISRIFLEQQASRYSFENHWCDLEKMFFREIRILICVLCFWSHLIFELIHWLNYLFIWQVFYLWDKRVYIKQVPFIKFNVLKMKNRIIKIIRLHKCEKYKTFKRTRLKASVIKLSISIRTQKPFNPRFPYYLALFFWFHSTVHHMKSIVFF